MEVGAATKDHKSTVRDAAHAAIRTYERHIRMAGRCGRFPRTGGAVGHETDRSPRLQDELHTEQWASSPGRHINRPSKDQVMYSDVDNRTRDQGPIDLNHGEAVASSRGLLRATRSAGGGHFRSLEHAGLFQGIEHPRRALLV